MQLGVQTLLPAASSSAAATSPQVHSTVPRVTSIVLPNPTGVLGRAADADSGLDAHSAASRATERGTYPLLAKLDDGELAITRSNLSGRAACIESGSTLDQPHRVAACTTSGGAYTTVTTAANARVQVQRSALAAHDRLPRAPQQPQGPARVMPRS